LFCETILRLQAGCEYAFAIAFATVTGEAGQFDERFRLGLGIERGFGPKFRLRVDATWQKVGAPFSGAPTDDLYIRVRAFHFWM